METNTTRRSVLHLAFGAGAATIASAALVPTDAVATTPHPLIAELDAFDDFGRDLEANPLTPDAEWDRWKAAQCKLYDRVEALPATAENVPVKLRAIQSIYVDEPLFADADKTTTDENLARQIVRALAEG